MSPKFPIDASKERVVRALNALGFEVIREHEHIALLRHNADGTRTTLTIPNHRTLKASTLRHAFTRAGIDRDDFLREYEKA